MTTGNTFLDIFVRSQKAYADEMEKAVPGHYARLSFTRFTEGVIVAVYVRGQDDPAAMFAIANDSWGKACAMTPSTEISWPGKDWGKFVELQIGGNKP